MQPGRGLARVVFQHWGSPSSSRPSQIIVSWIGSPDRRWEWIHPLWLGITCFTLHGIILLKGGEVELRQRNLRNRGLVHRLRWGWLFHLIINFYLDLFEFISLSSSVGVVSWRILPSRTPCSSPCWSPGGSWWAEGACSRPVWCASYEYVLWTNRRRTA